MIKYLEWDSSFFNKKIGLLELKSTNQDFEFEADFDLIYVISDTDFSIVIPKFINSFSETKVVFSKILVDENYKVDKAIVSILNSTPKVEIYDLAFESGKYSRFNLDPNFSKSAFKELYKKWVDNSYRKEFADDILVYVQNNRSIGFITYKIFENYANVGLIAINPKFQGKGIGRKLIEKVESELIAKGIKELRIPTQLQNEIACGFYHKMGYTILEEKNIKHYWKQ